MEAGIHSTLLYILLATLALSVASITAAAIISFVLLPKMIGRMISLSIGVMLSTSLLHALPEAIERHREPYHLFITLLVGLLGFFLLEKLSTLCHAYYREKKIYKQTNPETLETLPASWMVLVCDSFHHFTDGVLIAAAFLADSYLGIMTSMAIFAHEITQKVGNFIILLNSGFPRLRVYGYSLLCSSLSVIGGLAGYYTLDYAKPLIPYALTLAAAGFIYIAIGELLPQMKERVSVRETFIQFALIGAGIALICLITGNWHQH